METKLIGSNPQLEEIKSWCERKQQQENLEIPRQIPIFHDYFREFYTEFNLPDSVMYKREVEIINQNLKYNELYKTHRQLQFELHSLIKIISSDLENKMCSRKETIQEYKKHLLNMLKKYTFKDSVQEELIDRGIKL